MMSKKNFMNDISPAAAYFSNISNTNEAAANNNNNSNKEVKEKRDARANLLFTKTTKESLEKLAIVDRTSVNDIVNKLLEEYIATRQKDIARYDEFFKD